MAVDFVHTAEIVDAVLAVLRGHLPTTWFPATAAAGEQALRLLEHGDLADYPAAEDMEADLPAILVRGLGIEETGAGITGVAITEEHLRLVHVRAHDQCYTDAGARQTNMTRARERYAKIISKALFADPHRKLAVIDDEGARTEVTLTCTDGAGAQFIHHSFRGWDLGQDDGPAATPDVAAIRTLGLPVWAIACTFVARVRTGGPA
jgi:hypothetical protein